MKQIFQNLKKGTIELIQSPAPIIAADSIRIQTLNTLISVGTERMLVDFGRASYLQKARQQPDKVKMILGKIKTDGLLTTVAAVRSKLEQLLPMGYCNVGVVVDVGKSVEGFKVGDRVVSNGPHADLVVTKENLCAHLPDDVKNEDATFTVLASIGLQGIRLAQPTLGEAFVVMGAGLIGLLTIQLLKAQGCRVLAIDFDESKLALAQQFGAEICKLQQGEDPVAMGMRFSRGNGVDGVIITAATASNLPVKQAALMSRKRGRIILVGVTGLTLDRADFYEKELTFQVSCSYGPGRYDKAYEEKNLDYPIGFVRWTEKRNFEAVLDLLASKRLNVDPLITHRFAFDEAEQAYRTLTDDHTALGILLHYPTPLQERTLQQIHLQTATVFDAKKPCIGLIGAGNYASRMLIPAFKKANAALHTVVTSGGVSSAMLAKKAGFAIASTDVEQLFNDKTVNTILIVTRHNTHAKFVIQGLKASKHLFVEKPLALTLDELSEIEAVYQHVHTEGGNPHLMVGFNRRFSPHVQRMKMLLHSIHEPKTFIITVNAGAIPEDHWTQDSEVGGGRIIGEACHFIDLMRFLAQSPIISMQAQQIGGSFGIKEDKATITLGFADGSFGSIHYLANGAPSYPKERIDVFAGGKVLQLDNFRIMRGFGWSNFKTMRLWKQDKGQEKCAQAFLSAVSLGLPTPIPHEEVFEVARVTIEAANRLRQQA